MKSIFASLRERERERQREGQRERDRERERERQRETEVSQRLGKDEALTLFFRERMEVASSLSLL
jgi:hypothetical protein